MTSFARTLLALLCIAPSVRAGVIFSDDFDNINASQWTLTSTVGARGAGLQGFDTGNALHFAGWGTRSATTIALDVTKGQTISFDFRGGNEDIDGDVYWEDTESAAENGVLEYSTDGVNFFEIQELDLLQFQDDSPTTTWLTYTGIIPEAAKSTSTSFRWRQLNHSGWRWDEWAIDNVVIATPEPSSTLLIGIAAIVSVWYRRPRQRVLPGLADSGLSELWPVGT